MMDLGIVVVPSAFSLSLSHYVLLLRSIRFAKVTGGIRTKMVQLKESPGFLLDGLGRDSPIY